MENNLENHVSVHIPISSDKNQKVTGAEADGLQVPVDDMDNQISPVESENFDIQGCPSSASVGGNSKKGIKHALRQQAKRRRKNTTIASGGSVINNQHRLTTIPSDSEWNVDEFSNETACYRQPTMAEVLASIPGFNLKPRKRTTKKLSAAAQLEQTKEGCVDLETPDSILVNANLRQLLNKHTFSSLPPLYQYKLLQLLPHVDRSPSRTDSMFRLSSSGLNNEFFARACMDWRERLAEGEFTPENQAKLKAEQDKEKAKLDPWKLKHFEPMWGESLQEWPSVPTSLSGGVSLSEESLKEKQLTDSGKKKAPSRQPKKPLISTVVRPPLRRVGAVTRAVSSLAREDDDDGRGVEAKRSKIEELPAQSTPLNELELAPTQDAAVTDIATTDVATIDMATIDVGISEMVTPDVVSTDVATTDAVTPFEVAADVVIPDVFTTEVVAPDVGTTEVVTSDVVTTEVVASDVVTAESLELIDEPMTSCVPEMQPEPEIQLTSTEHEDTPMSTQEHIIDFTPNPDKSTEEISDSVVENQMFEVPAMVDNEEDVFRNNQESACIAVTECESVVTQPQQVDLPGPDEIKLNRGEEWEIIHVDPNKDPVGDGDGDDAVDGDGREEVEALLAAAWHVVGSNSEQLFQKIQQEQTETKNEVQRESSDLEVSVIPCKEELEVRLQESCLPAPADWATVDNVSDGTENSSIDRSNVPSNPMRLHHLHHAPSGHVKLELEVTLTPEVDNQVSSTVEGGGNGSMAEAKGNETSVSGAVSSTSASSVTVIPPTTIVCLPPPSAPPPPPPHQHSAPLPPVSSSALPFLTLTTSTPVRALPTKTVAKVSAGRRNNKANPPGTVNLERSYQICQAVIQNSPNREQLQNQLKLPPSLLAKQQQEALTNRLVRRSNSAPPPPTHHPPDCAACLCSLKALIPCLKCGAYCHHDCITPSRICLTCCDIR